MGSASMSLKENGISLVWYKEIPGTFGTLRGLDLNQRPLGYEPNELPDCSTPLFDTNNRFLCGQIGALHSHFVRLTLMRLTFMFLLRARPLSGGWQLTLDLQSMRLQVVCFNG